MRFGFGRWQSRNVECAGFLKGIRPDFSRPLQFGLLKKEKHKPKDMQTRAVHWDAAGSRRQPQPGPDSRRDMPGFCCIGLELLLLAERRWRHGTSQGASADGAGEAMCPAPQGRLRSDSGCSRERPEPFASPIWRRSCRRGTGGFRAPRVRRARPAPPDRAQAGEGVRASQEQYQRGRPPVE